jgi:hypothetical protein
MSEGRKKELSSEINDDLNEDVLEEDKVYKDYCTCDGLENFTGVPREYWDEAKAKEGLDNGCDSADLSQDGRVLADIVENSEGSWFVVEDSGSGIELAKLEKIFEYGKYTTSKIFKKLQRGLFGCGLKVIVSMSKLSLNRPVIIEAKGIKHFINLEIDEIQEKCKCVRQQSYSDVKNGTKIWIPISNADSVRKVLKLLPFVNFPGQAVNKTHISFYEPGEDFRKLRQKILKLDKEYTVKGFLMQFFGLNEKNIRMVLKQVPRQLKDIEDPDMLYHLIAIYTKKGPEKLLMSKLFGKHWQLLGNNSSPGGYKRLRVRNDKKDTIALVELLFLKENGVNIVPFLNRSIILPSLHDRIVGDIWKYKGDSFEKVRLSDYVKKIGLSLYFHIIYPKTDVFISKSKDIELPREIREQIMKAVENFRETQRQRQRPNEGKKKITQKEAVFELMEPAILHQTDNLTIVVYIRNVWYDIRERLIKAGLKPVSYDYFTPHLVNEYLNTHPDKRDLEAWITYKETGYIYFPDGTMIRDTLTEIKKKFKPDFLRYNKVLFMEKSGLLEGFIHKKFPQRYDCIMVTGGGYASRAIRFFLEKLAAGATIFCLHDLDTDGFNIFYTLKSASETMPDHTIEITDIGFTKKDIEALGITEEKINVQEKQNKALDNLYSNSVVDDETYRFLKEGKRVELNAVSMLEIVDFVEEKLKALGLANKVLPPKDVFFSHKKEIEENVKDEVTYKGAIEELEPEIKQIREKKERQINMRLAPCNSNEMYEEVKAVLAKNPPACWKEILTDLVKERVYKAANIKNTEFWDPRAKN